MLFRNCKKKGCFRQWWYISILCTIYLYGFIDILHHWLMFRCVSTLQTIYSLLTIHASVKGYLWVFAFVTNNVLNGIFACFLKSHIFWLLMEKRIFEKCWWRSNVHFFFQDCLARGNHTYLINMVFFFFFSCFKSGMFFLT